MGRKIVVTSGKGGVGKTTVTSGLGIALSDLGHKVCMVDADIGLNNLDVVMCMENLVVYDILDVATGKCRLRQALVQDRYNPLLYVLPSSKLSDAPELTPQTFSDIVNSLAENFEYVLIDCPAGIEGGFHRAVSSASEALVVTTPTVSVGQHKTYRQQTPQRHGYARRDDERGRYNEAFEMQGRGNNPRGRHGYAVFRRGQAAEKRRVGKSLQTDGRGAYGWQLRFVRRQAPKQGTVRFHKKKKGFLRRKYEQQRECERTVEGGAAVG